MPSDFWSGGYTAASFDDTKRSEEYSHLAGIFRPTTTTSFGVICKSTSDEKCSGAVGFFYTAVLKVCKSETETNCIKSVKAISRTGTVIDGEFVEYSLPGYQFYFDGDLDKGIPEGSSASIWRFPSISHDGGDEFALNFAARNSTGNFGEPTFLNGTILPMSRKSGKFRLPTYFGKDAGPGNFGGPVGGDGSRGGAPECGLTLSESQCALLWPHPEGVSYQVVVRTQSKWSITRFMQGRIANPLITLAKDNLGNQELTITAKPMKVPVIAGWRKNNRMNQELDDSLEKLFEGGSAGGTIYGDASPPQRTLIGWIPNYETYNNRLFDLYLLWLKEFEDRSTGTKSVWFVRTLRIDRSNDTEVDSNSKTGKCISDSKDFAGLVTSNAGMYVTGPPTFNEETATLDYKVSSPHLDENGKENVGSYDLVLKSDVARCIYGFSNAPIQGSISVVDSEGKARIATTVVNERDGFLYLSANGFTYSSPTVKVKLTQAAPTPTPIPSATATPSPTPSASSQVVTAQGKTKRTITCVKGTTKRKVTSVAPKCPKGFKRV